MSELATIQNTGMAPLVEAVMSGNLDPEKLAQFLEVQKDLRLTRQRKHTIKRWQTLSATPRK